MRIAAQRCLTAPICVTHLDVIRLSGKYLWLQGVATLQALNLEGSGDKISFGPTMRVEVLPLDNTATTAASPAAEPEQRGPAARHPRNRRR